MVGISVGVSDEEKLGPIVGSPLGNRVSLTLGDEEGVIVGNELGFSLEITIGTTVGKLASAWDIAALVLEPCCSFRARRRGFLGVALHEARKKIAAKCIDLFIILAK